MMVNVVIVPNRQVGLTCATEKARGHGTTTKTQRKRKSLTHKKTKSGGAIEQEFGDHPV